MLSKKIKVILYQTLILEIKKKNLSKKVSIKINLIYQKIKKRLKI